MIEVIVLIFVGIILLLIILATIYYATKPTVIAFENYNPPNYINFPSVPYTIEMTGNDTAKLTWLEDLGLDQGVVTAVVNISNVDNVITLWNFRYTNIIGRSVLALPQGPFIITMNGTDATLSGHYRDIVENLVRTI